MKRRRALPRVPFRVWLRAGRNARSSVLHERRRPATRLRHAPTEERHKLKANVPPIKTHATCAPRRRADSPPFPHQMRPTQSHTHTLDTAALAVLRRHPGTSVTSRIFARFLPRSILPLPPVCHLAKSAAAYCDADGGTSRVAAAVTAAAASTAQRSPVSRPCSKTLVGPRRASSALPRLGDDACWHRSARSPPRKPQLTHGGCAWRVGICLLWLCAPLSRHGRPGAAGAVRR